MFLLINRLIGPIHFHSLGICGKADKLYGTDIISGHVVSAAHSQCHIWLLLLQAAAHAPRAMTIEWPGEQTVRPIRATWSEELAFPECCRLLFCNEAPPGPNWPRQKRWGEGEEERRGGGGITRKSWHLPSAESLPSTACAQSRAEERRGGRKKKKKKRRGEMKSHWSSAWGRERNGITTPWQEITGYFGMSETNMLNTHIYTYKKTEQVRRDTRQCC